jgi:hypothetical protein
MPRSVRKELRLTPEMVRAIDQARGDVSFNRWAERAFEKALGSADGHGGRQTGAASSDAPSSSEGLGASRERTEGVLKAPVPAPPRAPLPPMKRASDLVRRDSAAMERQRRMNESKGL